MRTDYGTLPRVRPQKGRYRNAADNAQAMLAPWEAFARRVIDYQERNLRLLAESGANGPLLPAWLIKELRQLLGVFDENDEPRGDPWPVYRELLRGNSRPYQDALRKGDPT